MMDTIIKKLQELCLFLHIDFMIKYYDTHEVCFKGVDDNEQEVFNVAVWYPRNTKKRRFYIELNSERETWTGGQFSKETILLFLSIDELTDEELHIKQIITEAEGESK